MKVVADNAAEQERIATAVEKAGARMSAITSALDKLLEEELGQPTPFVLMVGVDGVGLGTSNLPPDAAGSLLCQAADAVRSTQAGATHPAPATEQ